MQWNTLPTKLQKELFDNASSVVNVLQAGGGSDASFWKEGYPAVMATDTGAASVSALPRHVRYIRQVAIAVLLQFWRRNIARPFFPDHDP